MADPRCTPVLLVAFSADPRGIPPILDADGDHCNDDHCEQAERDRTGRVSDLPGAHALALARFSFRIERLAPAAT
ncbi:hypothetical protein [uncultured Gordonia sp.]|uniref:hypothetical protein n=1 Tax=uncultured Gordonia sp. TaxID=198437 RepID=UPI00258A84E2|nr:hypothetical protein [uncultured Gordonia sp.]